MKLSFLLKIYSILLFILVSNNTFINNASLIHNKNALYYEYFLEFENGFRIWIESSNVKESQKCRKCTINVYTSGAINGKTTANVALRTGPGRDFEKITIKTIEAGEEDDFEIVENDYLPKGTSLIILAITAKAVDNQNWYYVYTKDYADRTEYNGWVHENYIEENPGW